ncbi:hypothetical protein Pmar_PMAR003699 [Perkinsus marinus ATCC 50983]|uniref:Uncharacterized protein n=1 Tax=Perkinsus marinus (strain ATCC 50983 / TXsc) TaxID=423536 RepID=C5KI24_PERM5|nr:hypothetical protein Pmar_PMAR003699 [Perkinsus marinus ATCC 50983]EER16236.1 hypothetical protein Pmar_PMAR003699 [Perkinsus marinus ATCC 50983]|eukprot:XP_002784440.1 hypothetical protein Pmar_PMAR003699 [Perkinsus marinus ATCC 50983]
MRFTICHCLLGAVPAIALRRRGSEYQLTDLVTATSNILNALEETEQTMDRSVMVTFCPVETSDVASLSQAALMQWPLIPGSAEAPPASIGSLRGTPVSVKAGATSTPLPIAQALLNVIISLVISAILLTAATIVYRHTVAGWLRRLSARRFLSPVLRSIHKPTRSSSIEVASQPSEKVPALVIAPATVDDPLTSAMIEKTPDSDSDNASTVDEESLA